MIEIRRIIIVNAMPIRIVHHLVRKLVVYFTVFHRKAHTAKSKNRQLAFKRLIKTCRNLTCLRLTRLHSCLIRIQPTDYILSFGKCSQACNPQDAASYNLYCSSSVHFSASCHFNLQYNFNIFC